MTRKDYILIAECIAECHNKGYDLDDTIGYFRYRLRDGNRKFSPTKFKEFIYELTKPDHIPEEQAKQWAIKKSEKT